MREKYSTKIDEEVDSVIQKYKQQIENGRFRKFSEFFFENFFDNFSKRIFLERAVLNREIEKQETLNARVTSELRGYLEGINATINERTKTEQ